MLVVIEAKPYSIFTTNNFIFNNFSHAIFNKQNILFYCKKNLKVTIVRN